VRLGQLKVVDHFVVVDGDRTLILDSEEKYPIALSVSTLQMCGGKEADKLEVFEVRELRKAAGALEPATNK